MAGGGGAFNFERLINAISTPNTKVFVHIDSKSTLVEFRKRITQENVVFIKKRVSVNWGAFSMVQATLNLLSEALNSKNGCDYYCLLSGVDYPLKSQIYIENYLKQHYGSEFISTVEIPNKSVDRPLNRISTFCPNIDFYKKLMPSSWVAKIRYQAGRWNIKRPYEPIFKDMKPYGGSQFWALTHSAVQYIIEFVAANPEFVGFFKNTWIPDESFFQTIIGNSQFQDQVTGSLTFADWSRNTPPYPAIIDSEHIQYFQEKDDFLIDGIYETKKTTALCKKIPE